MTHVNIMEDRLCCCGKGKECEVLGEVSPVLGSPLILSHDINSGTISDNSYHTPTVTSSSILSSSSPVNSNKENMVVLYDSWESHLVEINEDSVKNVSPVPVPAPSLDMAGISQLITCMVKGLPVLLVVPSPHFISMPFAVV